MKAPVTSSRSISLNYRPRAQFEAFHRRSERFAVLVCHRRAGKTVAVIGDMVARAFHTKKPNAFYAYLAPFAGQARQVSWTYFLQAVKDGSGNLLPGVTVHESSSLITLPNGARIKVMGADNADALRGLYFDGVVCDEFGDFLGGVWSEVIRPAIADRRGWAVFIGTPRGKNKFFEMAERAQGRDKDGRPVKADAQRWFYLKLKASESGILPATELAAIREELDENEFEQEMEVSFDATVRGSYYGKHIAQLASRGGIADLEYDSDYPVSLAMDIGFADATAIWFWQVINGQVRFIDFWEGTGSDAEEVVAMLQMKPYDYQTWWLPHDAVHRTFRSKKSVLDTIRDFNAPARIVPNLALKDGIDAVRKTLRTYPLVFNIQRTVRGVECLKNYTRKWDADTKVYSNIPKHDQWSHGADAFRYACLVINQETIQESIEAARTKAELDRREAVELLNRSQQTLDELWEQRERSLRARRSEGSQWI